MARYGTYSAVHDSILRKYRRYSLYGVWTGFLSLICIVIFLAGYLTDQDSTGIGGVYNIAVLLSLLICQYGHLERVWFVILNIIFLLPIGGLMAYFGYMAHKGKKLFLILSIIVYGIDGLLLAFTPLLTFYEFSPIDYVISVVAHVGILMMLGLAIFKRHELIGLAQKQKAELDIPENPNKEKIVLSYNKKKRKDAEFNTFGEMLDDDENSK